MKDYDTLNRLKPFDTLLDCVTKLSEGYPGAINIIMQGIHVASPDEIILDRTLVDFFDKHLIYGRNIWMFAKHITKFELGALYTLILAEKLLLVYPSHIVSALEDFKENKIKFNILELTEIINQMIPDLDKRYIFNKNIFIENKDVEYFAD